MGKNNSYTASYKLKVMFRRTVREPCSTKRIRNSGIQRALLEETKRIIKNAKSDSRVFRGPKAEKSAYFTRPNFSAVKLEKKSARITRVNTVTVGLLQATTSDTRTVPATERVVQL
jgi:hypothetical protein